MSSIVFRQKPHGFRTNFTDFDKKGDVKIYTKKAKNGYDYINRNKVTKNIESIDEWKVVTSRSTSVPEEDNGQVLRISQTFIAEPNSVLTESYVVVGSFKTEGEAQNCLSYLKTRFFRLLCQMTIVSPDVSPRTFDLVPLQSFDEKWDDSKLYRKYKLSIEEIEYLESIIREV
jgi:site-specific DNA-methyltransferase (adenine-specific)